MAIDVSTIDLTHVQDVTDIEPHPQLAISGDTHHFGSIGAEAKGYLLELLEATEETGEPVGTRVFERIGVDYEHAAWEDFDLFWVEGGDEAFAEALRRWHSAYIMQR